jgi:hypothetical protein
VETVCYYTLSPRGPNLRKLGSWGIGWTCGASPPGGIPQKPLRQHSLWGTVLRCSYWSFVGLGALGEGSRAHKALHDAAVLEFVPDGVSVVWASLLKEPLQVVCGHPC